MTPGFAANYASDVSRSNPEPLSKRLEVTLLAGIERAYFNHIFFGEFGHAGLFASANSLRASSGHMLLAAGRPSLGNHVGHVVVRRPEEQVVRSDAFPIVTHVTNEETCRYHTVRYLPRNAMRPDLFSGFKFEVSVATKRQLRRPLPATVSLPNLGPKSTKKTSVNIGVVASAGAISLPFLSGRHETNTTKRTSCHV